MDRVIHNDVAIEATMDRLGNRDPVFTYNTIVRDDGKMPFFLYRRTWDDNSFFDFSAMKKKKVNA